MGSPWCSSSMGFGSHSEIGRSCVPSSVVSFGPMKRGFDAPRAMIAVRPSCRGSDQKIMRTRQIGAVVGMVGPAIFVAISLIGAWIQPGYSALSDYVSALSLGDHG